MNTERDTGVYLQLDKNKQLTVNAKGVFLPDAIQICLAGIEALCKQTLARADSDELRKSLEEDMYEMINLGASTLLDRLFPEIEMRPDVTVDALMKIENELIQDKGQEYVNAYNESTQSAKDIYEHNLAKAELAAKEAVQAKKKKFKK